ncbi:SDR family NAD(P)-dependent oxidoreductase [Halalkalibacter krulwichiae]|uniref:3-oxoacyl-[acyl-carrier-protein] reductase FabG n=1 Tax=Halalkalibacter krulwichiae TaxID=199441 RepID=A0A1X9M7S0_9BACI|nr:glucose 1-dehydrogenase [Halalkalibacter krulwichiae]ARK29468.1 3-oxoacyl-[acyl-carrier-protein] reductase FabG [Halalkalibacter krulwichiae]
MDERIVIVTGAGQGLGAAIAKEFATNGDIVIVADVKEGKAREVANDIVKNGGEAHAILCDVKKEEHIVELVNHVEYQFGNIDILVNNAGISRFKPFYELTVEEWDEVQHTNVRSAFIFSKEVAKVMRKKKSGSIINIASTRAKMSEADSEAYAASKGAMLALTHALAASLQNDYIQVNAISPGWIHTGVQEELSERDHEQHFSKRVGNPGDIARACLFLADERNQFINGENLVIDGGMTRKMIYE